MIIIINAAKFDRQPLVIGAIHAHQESLLISVRELVSMLKSQYRPLSANFKK